MKRDLCTFLSMLFNFPYLSGRIFPLSMVVILTSPTPKQVRSGHTVAVHAFSQSYQYVLRHSSSSLFKEAVTNWTIPTESIGFPIHVLSALPRHGRSSLCRTPRSAEGGSNCCKIYGLVRKGPLLVSIAPARKR